MCMQFWNFADYMQTTDYNFAAFAIILFSAMQDGDEDVNVVFMSSPEVK